MNSIITPSGRYMGRKPDVPKDTDRKYMFAHTAEMRAPRPPSVDLRDKLLPCFDQGALGSCGANAGAGLMAFLYPSFMASRLKLYYDVRELEGDVSQDSGVQTRDVLEVLTQTGASPESEWPYDIDKFAQLPPMLTDADASQHKLKSFARLTTADEYLACLANGFPFLVGFNVPDFFDDPQMGQTGIMSNPDVAPPEIGGHDVLAVGYDLAFRSSKAVQDAGIEPALVSDHALLIRNSWGTEWGYQNGYFWMPLRWAIDVTTSADAWTGRI